MFFLRVLIVCIFSLANKAASAQRVLFLSAFVDNRQKIGTVVANGLAPGKTPSNSFTFTFY